MILTKGKHKMAVNYNFKKVLPNNKTNGIWMMQELSNNLGNNFREWHKHPDYMKILEDCHYRIFNNPKPFLKARGSNALALRVNFLDRAFVQDKQTKMKRASCYNGALFEALGAGVITPSDYNNHKV